MKLTKLIGIGALVSGITYIVKEIRNELQYRAIMREIALDDAEEVEAQDIPKFEVGTPVIIACPYESEYVEPPQHTVITRVGYSQNDEIYIYQVEGSTEWYNEKWLTYDEYGPKTFEVETESEIIAKERKETVRAIEKAIDDTLDEYNDYHALFSEFGDEEYAEKARQASLKLYGLKRQLEEIENDE